MLTSFTLLILTLTHKVTRVSVNPPISKRWYFLPVFELLCASTFTILFRIMRAREAAMPHLFLRLLLALLLVGFTTAAVYVSTSSTCTTGCGSAALPWKTIAQGIAGVGSAGGTVIVLPGTYTGTGNNNLLVTNSGGVTIQ